MKRILFPLVFALGVSAETPHISFNVIREIDHDTDAFTQGLIFHDGFLWESTGSPGGGTRIRQIDTASGDVVKSTPKFDNYFGEGLSFDGRFFYQLSWKAGEVYLFQYPSLEPVASIPYRGEGWGLARTDEGNFFHSNGSDTITLRNGHFQEESVFTVTMDDAPLQYINELEWVDSSLYANIWYSDSIVKIDISSGNVTNVIDLSNLREAAGATASEQVVNGIAWESENRYWVTGKFWNRIYLIELDQ